MCPSNVQEYVLIESFTLVNKRKKSECEQKFGQINKTLKLSARNNINFTIVQQTYLKLIYLYFPPSSYLIYVCFCPVGLSLL